MAIVAVCRLAIQKRIAATPLTLLLAHWVQEQVKVQVQRGGKMKTWGGSRTTSLEGEYTEFSNSILPKFYLSFWTTCPYKEHFRCCFR